uniref:Uncharacterized protein n=1 Tax=Cannabis sativa TaxID=3483 RepID=A0A803P320_CANSA
MTAATLYLQIVHELGGDHDTGDEQAMNIKGVNGQQWLTLSKTIKINISNDEARRATIGVLEDPLKVGVDGNGGSGKAMEDRDLLGVEWPIQVV